MTPANDIVRELLLAGEHELPNSEPLLEAVSQAEFFAVVHGDPMAGAVLQGLAIEIHKVVLPIFTHEEIARSGMSLEPGAWFDRVSIRQAAHFVLDRQWHGVYINFRERGWLIQREFLSYLMSYIPKVA